MSTNPFSDTNFWWNHYGHHYDDRDWRYCRGLLGEVVQHAEPGLLLDMGCGYGFLVECARQFGLPALGLDGSTAALAEGRRRHPLSDLREWQAGTALPVADGTAGAVVLNEFIDHISLEHNHALFDEIVRVLKPGGTVVVRSPSVHNRFDDDQGHITTFTRAAFRAFVTQHGLDVLFQPYVPQPLLGSSGPARKLMWMLTRFIRPERWAATIGLTARKPPAA